jgi:hypothetical protein
VGWLRRKQIKKYSILPFNSWLALPKMLKALVQSMIRRHPNSLCPEGRIHCRTCGYKWGLLKVRKGKEEQGVAQMESGGQKRVLFFPRYF